MSGFKSQWKGGLTAPASTADVRVRTGRIVDLDATAGSQRPKRSTPKPKPSQRDIIGGAVTTTSMPVLIPLNNEVEGRRLAQLRSAVLERHPHFTRAHDRILRPHLSDYADARRGKEASAIAEVVDTAAHAVAAEELETAMETAGYDVAALRIDMDDRDKLEQELEVAAGEFATALRGQTPTTGIVDRVAARLGCHKHGCRQDRAEDGEYRTKLAEWRALNQADVNSMLDTMEMEEPAVLRAFVGANTSLDGVKGWFKRNFGNKKTRDAQIQKDYEKMVAKRKQQEEAGMQGYARDDDRTIDAELEDNGADDPFATADYVTQQQKLGAALDAATGLPAGEPLELNILKKIKEAAGKLKRKMGATPTPLLLEPFDNALSLEQGGALLSLLSLRASVSLNTVATAGRTIATKCTLITRELSGDRKIKYVLDEKAVDVRTYLVNRSGALSSIGGAKIVAVSLNMYKEKLGFTSISGAGTKQIEFTLRLPASELAHMDSEKLEKEKITLNLRFTDGSSAQNLFYTNHGNPLVICDTTLDYLNTIYLDVLPEDVQPSQVLRERLRSAVATLARWIQQAAQNKASLDQAHEEMRALSLARLPTQRDRLAQARANQVLEEALRQKIMAALEYKPDEGAYPVQTMLAARDYPPTIGSPSAALLSALDAVSGEQLMGSLKKLGGDALAVLKQLAQYLLEALGELLKDPVRMRNIAAIISQLLHSGGTRVVSISDSGVRIQHLWNPRLNKLQPSFFAYQ